MRKKQIRKTKKQNKHKQKTQAKVTKTTATQNAPDWYQFGKTKYGEPIPEIEMPKARLSPTESKVLSMIVKLKIDSKENAKSMLDLLEPYCVEWPDDNFTVAKMSRDLAKLKKSEFLSAIVGAPVNINRVEQRYIRKKSLYWLSNKALSGEITVDENRWVKVNGEYVANETTRVKKMTREIAR